ncbi:MAG TPA: hypothetical protein VHY82_16255 [Acetobacteraceae bacterium]|nr:hypothetical protein [Acetobacteraceae bacterium]
MSSQCFLLLRRASAPALGPLRLTDTAAQALARVLPIMGCGEEAASMAFDGLARAHSDDPAASGALRSIAAEELTHDALIRSVAACLPSPNGIAGVLALTRRFHVDLGRGDTTAHLSRIAALDSAVCTILARLFRPGAPLMADATVASVFRRIARDEARHVRVSRGLATDRRDGRILRDIAGPAREALARLLSLAADDFEALGVDSDRLLFDLARLPDGLFGG